MPASIVGVRIRYQWPASRSTVKQSTSPTFSIAPACVSPSLIRVAVANVFPWSSGTTGRGGGGGGEVGGDEVGGDEVGGDEVGGDEVGGDEVGDDEVGDDEIGDEFGGDDVGAPFEDDDG